MLDIGWWELFVMGMVALLVVGPKELPTLLRTIGRYVGVIKRQADEFRSQFDDALRDSEFNDLKTEMESIKSDVSTSVNDAENSIKKELDETDYDWDSEEPIKPAQEFADHEETTSFTTADGEVISKQDAGPAKGSASKESTAETEQSPAVTNGADETQVVASNGDGTQTNEPPGPEGTTGDTKNARNAETVR